MGEVVGPQTASKGTCDGLLPTHCCRSKRLHQRLLCSDLDPSSAEIQLPLTGIERSLDAPTSKPANISDRWGAV
jgi:hypothetical protein